jgi:hypothetical protein
MRRLRSVWSRTGVLEDESRRRAQVAPIRPRPDLPMLTDAELESLLPLAKKMTAAGDGIAFNPGEHALLASLHPRVRWRKR